MTILRARQALTPAGWATDVDVEISPHGRIAAVRPQDGPADHRCDLLLPAPVNLHSHAFQRAMAGLTEARGPDGRDSFWTWRRLMYRFLDRLTPDDVEAIAAQVYVEMAEAGYAAVAEFHYLHHAPGGRPYARRAEMADRCAAAAAETGLGLTLLPVLYRWGGCDRRPLEGGQTRFGNDLDGFADLHAQAAETVVAGPADWTIGVAPHSLRAVGPEDLDAAAALAPDAPLHMHLAEQVAEVAEVQAHRGARPVQWLVDAQEVDARWCLIHCTQMTATETAALAGTGAVAGLCPITEANLGDGIFNGTAYAQAGGRWGVGSDSNVQIALWDELRTLEYSQRLRDRSRAALATANASTGRVLMETAAAGGAQAAGRDAGAIAEGRWADLVAVETETPWLAGRRRDAALDSLIFCGGNARAVRDVWSAGRHVVQSGRHVARARVARRYLATMARLGQDL
ncbi:formimidoylglutamate deiminase [Rhodobacteraceae bacterium CCMM004]|nr:formimidoylglutamate deiminase [Rhodobacteraceae bacterium CCMM004]